MYIRSFLLAALFVSVAALAQEAPKPAPQPSKPSTQKTTAVMKQVPNEDTNVAAITAAAVATVTLEARCSSCDKQIQGKITVDAQRIAFCCGTWMEPGAKVSARCPYSFTVALQEVKEQFLEAEGAIPVWHVVTNGDVAYAFASPDKQGARDAFEKLQKLSPAIKSAKLIDQYASALAVKSKPKLEASAATCE